MLIWSEEEVYWTKGIYFHKLSSLLKIIIQFDPRNSENSKKTVYLIVELYMCILCLFKSLQ